MDHRFNRRFPSAIMYESCAFLTQLLQKKMFSCIIRLKLQEGVHGMYRLLLIAPSAEGLDLAFWRAQGFTPAPACASVDDALLQLSQQSFDAIAAPDSHMPTPGMRP